VNKTELENLNKIITYKWKRIKYSVSTMRN